MPALSPTAAGAASPGGAWRLPSGGRIDRDRVLRFRWDGRELTGYAGDTLASALLAHGERVVGRGMKFHRPRGVLSAGIEEPNALVGVGSGGRFEPNARATMLRLREGLVARPQNCWPTVRFDLGRVLDLTAPLWPAGFYNKTFLWPSWHAYEGLIRRTAGLGDAPPEADPDRYDAVHARCELLVVGAGAAGLYAALLGARAGLDVLLVEQDAEAGGALLVESAVVDGRPAAAWADRAVAELRASPNVRLLTATCAFGLYDHGRVGLLERVAERDPAAPIRERYWRVDAREIVLATGALEQPWVYERNDLPGTMLAGAARAYARRYGVAVGRRVIVATNNDSGHAAALDLLAAGVHVAALVDVRPGGAPLATALRERGVDVHHGACPLTARGAPAVRCLRVCGVDGRGSREFECDAVVTSGGWMPAVHLWSHARGRLAYDATRRAFLPVAGTAPAGVAGSLAGSASLAEAFASAERAVLAAADRLGRCVPPPPRPTIEEPALRPDVDARRSAPAGRRSRQWIDLQHDVTLADLDLAIREGFDAVEHLKRYTTTGMSVDQGKTSNLNALLAVAELTGRTPDAVGTTTFRPPYSPVTLGALAGRTVGDALAPQRRLPAHDEHVALGATFEEAGGWLRPAWYQRAGEVAAAAIEREVRAVRTAAGLFDASPLGKIEVEGRDAARFLDFVYVNNVATLAVGRARYGLMLDERGTIVDDGTFARVAPERFVLTTTSGGAARIAAWLEEWRQGEFPNYEVLITPVTTQWATCALAGPRAREILARLPGDVDLSREAFPHLHVREGTLAGVAARLWRVSFSGELGYEINVPASYGPAIWRALLDAGREHGLTPYGLESLLLLRLEKGFLHVGLDTDGTTCPADVGWGAVVERKAADFVGRRSLRRPEYTRPDRRQLVGLELVEGEALVAGAHLRWPGTTEGSDGYVTSAAHSPTLGRRIALALLAGGRARMGDTVEVHDFERRATARIVPMPFYDPEGTRLDG